MKWKTISSSSSLDGIKENISKFFFGSRRLLVEKGAARKRYWAIFNPYLKEEVKGLRVIKKNNEFLFQMEGM